jgi:hypothetical protein
MNLELLVVRFPVRQRGYRPANFDLHSVLRSDNQAGVVALEVELVERPNSLLPLTSAKLLLYRLRRLAVSPLCLCLGSMVASDTQTGVATFWRFVREVLVSRIE